MKRLRVRILRYSHNTDSVESNAYYCRNKIAQIMINDKFTSVSKPIFYSVASICVLAKLFKLLGNYRLVLIQASCVLYIVY